LIEMILAFVTQEASVPRGELEAWAAELEALSSEGRYFFLVTHGHSSALKSPLASANPEQGA
jgi:hypothetical protein